MTTPLEDRAGLTGIVVAELFGPDGELKHRHIGKNLVTAVGDQTGGVGFMGGAVSTYPTAMKLGTGSTAVAKTGAGAALVTYLTGSNITLSPAIASVAGVVTAKSTWTTGVATTASPITEVALGGPSNTNATWTAADTVARALIAGISSKGAGDVLVVTWTITFLGA